LAKHPVPKRRATKTRGDRRYSTWRTKTLKKLMNFARSIFCTKCGQSRQSHTVCHTCGTYRGRTVIDFEKKKAKKEKKIKKVKA
jgi:large subunit ribosomal protein L32